MGGGAQQIAAGTQAQVVDGGIGQALLNFARERSPDHVWLYTLQINVGARAFYEKNGFVAEKFGISPPPENEPDVEYHWRRI